ncbi:MAG: parvulin-like peptidyl-prolyl isomerase [Chthonomonadaceae bacterium]|nr:parvulin-like peptidyl-prolyl isomerase [Chthonomonadaceae bacterium]
MTNLEFAARRGPLLLAALLVMAGLMQVDRATAQGEKPAAIVNGEIITQGEFFERLQRLHGQTFLTPNNQLRPENAGQLILDLLINERLTLQAANKANVALSDTETATELANLKKQPAVQGGLTNHQFTEEMLKFDIRVQGARFKLATAGVKVTPAEVESFYKAHIADYTVPEQWGLSVIRTGNVDTLAKIDADLKAGKSFADTAKLYSEDKASRDKGGDSGMVYANDTRVPTPLRDAVRLLKPGEISPVVKLEQDLGPGKPRLVTWWRLLLRSRDPEVVRPFDDIKSGLERLAMIEKAGGYQVADKKISDLRSQSEIKVSIPGYENLETKR